MKLVAMLLVSAFAAAAPTTTITAGPGPQSTLTSPTFEFSSDSAGAGFECSIDSAPFAACSSPYTVGPLVLGSHSFSVRAIAADGTPDPSPPLRQWSVVGSPTDYATLKLTQPRRLHMKVASFRKLAGTSASPSGVHSVYAALQLSGPDKNLFPPGCTYLDLRTARLIEQPCILPHYTRLKGTSSWSYTLPVRVRRALRPGSFKLVFRAFNGYDQAIRTDFKLVLR